MSFLSDPSFTYVLGKVEKFPGVTFTETELKKVSSKGFEKLMEEKLLKYKQSDPEQQAFPCPTPCEKGCDRVIGKIGKSYKAVCPGDSSVKPIALKKSDLNRYIFDINVLQKIIKKKNQLVGSISKIHNRLFFIGEKSVVQNQVAVILGFVGNEKQAEPVILGIHSRFLVFYDQTLVLLPFFDKITPSLLATLDRLKVRVATFKQAFPKSDFVIDFTILEKRIETKRGVEYPKKTQKQLKDYDKQHYLCEDRLYIIGKGPKKRSNLIRVNDKEITIPDSEMLVLLRLVMELKKAKGGWVETNLLYKEDITQEDIPHRLFGRLRKKLSLGLIENNPQDFIENDGRGSYRISTHPDFVEVKERNWLSGKYDELRVAIRKVRERKESQREKEKEANRRRERSKQK